MSSHNSESEVSDTELEMSKKASTEPERKRGRPKKLSLKDLPPKDQEKVKERFAKARLEGEAGVRNKMKILKQMEVDEKHIKLDEAINARAERIAELRRQKEEEAERAKMEVKEKAKEVPVKQQIVVPDEEEVEIEYRKAKPKPKKKRIVYVEESSSEEEEIVVKKKPKVKAKPKKVVEEEEEEDENLVKQEIVKREVKDKVDKMRDEVLRSYMNSFFPRM